MSMILHCTYTFICKYVRICNDLELSLKNVYIRIEHGFIYKYVRICNDFELSLKKNI